MRTLGGGFTTEKDKRFATPSLVARVLFSTGTVYISERDISIGGTSYSGVIKTWGSLRGMLNRREGIADLAAVTLRGINLESTPFSDDLSNVSNVPEMTEVQIDQVFDDGTTTYTEKLFVGVMQDPISYDEQEWSFSVLTLGEKWLRKLPGFLINQTDYTNADPDDVGKMAPIIYGSVTNIPCLAVVAGAQTYLTADITNSATTINVSDTTYFPSTGTLQCANEQITYTGTTATSFTGCTRGANSTTAAAHKKDNAIFEVRSDYEYLIAGHAITSVSAVYVDGVKQSGSDYTVYLTRSLGGHTIASVVFSVPPKIEKSPYIEVSDAHAVSDNIDFTNQDGVAISNYFAGTPVSATYTGTGGGSASANTGGVTYGNWKTGTQRILKAAWGVNHDPADPRTITIKINYYGKPATTVYQWNGSRVTVDSGSPWIYNLGTTNPQHSITITITTSGSGGLPNVVATLEWATYEYDVNPTALSKTGAASKTGTVTLSGNSSANTVIGSVVSVDCVGYSNGTDPTDVIKHFLETVLGVPTSNIDTASFTTAAALMDASYAFNGAITQQRTAREILADMARQCRCFFDWSYEGKAQLLYRKSVADQPAIQKTITQDAIRALRIERTPVAELINTIDAKYDRDHTLGAEPYRKTKHSEDSTSVTNYGKREAPGLFVWDFVDDDTMVADLVAYYLERYKTPKRIVSLDCFLDQFELERADIIGISYLRQAGVYFDGLDGTGKFVVEQIDNLPGDKDTIDQIRLVAREL